MNTPYVLIAYYSRHGSIETMAKHIARGVSKVSGIEARIRQIPNISTTTEQTETEIPESGHPYIELNDLSDCAGLVIGSPSYFGSMAAPVKHLIDQSSTLWMSGQLCNKPAGAFTSASSMHGGHEMTIQSIMTPLLHHGMVWLGLPYKNKSLITTMSGGTPYGASHLAKSTGESKLTTEEQLLCEAQGERIAQFSLKLL
ncbi:NAD(P)H:quinone oxidoreductase [Marinomonas balearica]|uniref:NAD(P)H dehydrogenase (Quinone) n=1 Tax=Marinomonas balearica TaxID=491947 RepID=A0A4R6MFX5_9GAMM|nr:NAD(P)H:quinone oxidoreductase [Marinomonas balearica]TDO99029.1 NAD(P)H dehydrogenase (quinone) [Marinomonas balearica]